jgi:hypothetical protein
MSIKWRPDPSMTKVANEVSLLRRLGKRRRAACWHAAVERLRGAAPKTNGQKCAEASRNLRLQAK